MSNLLDYSQFLLLNHRRVLEEFSCTAEASLMKFCRLVLESVIFSILKCSNTWEWDTFFFFLNVKCKIYRFSYYGWLKQLLENVLRSICLIKHCPMWNLHRVVYWKRMKTNRNRSALTGMGDVQVGWPWRHGQSSRRAGVEGAPRLGKHPRCAWGLSAFHTFNTSAFE